MYIPTVDGFKRKLEEDERRDEERKRAEEASRQLREQARIAEESRKQDLDKKLREDELENWGTVAGVYRTWHMRMEELLTFAGFRALEFESQSNDARFKYRDEKFAVYGPNTHWQLLRGKLKQVDTLTVPELRLVCDEIRYRSFVGPFIEGRPVMSLEGRTETSLNEGGYQVVNGKGEVVNPTERVIGISPRGYPTGYSGSKYSNPDRLTKILREIFFPAIIVDTIERKISPIFDFAREFIEAEYKLLCELDLEAPVKRVETWEIIGSREMVFCSHYDQQGEELSTTINLPSAGVYAKIINPDHRERVLDIILAGNPWLRPPYRGRSMGPQ